jgi:hypothetical protein
MDKLLVAYDLLSLNKEDISHLNSSIANNDTEAVINSLPTKKSPEGFTSELYKIEITQMFLKRIEMQLT